MPTTATSCLGVFNHLQKLCFTSNKASPLDSITKTHTALILADGHNRGGCWFIILNFQIISSARCVEDIKKQFGAVYSDAVGRMREGNVVVIPGFDGQFGKIKLFS